MKLATKQQASTITFFAFLMAFCMALPIQAQLAPARSQTPPATVDGPQTPKPNGDKDKQLRTPIGRVGMFDPTVTVAGTPPPKNGGTQAGPVIPGQYIVVLKKNAATASLKSKAPVERKQMMRELAVSTLKRNSLSGAKVQIVYGTALIGFSVSDLSEADAEKLRRDAQVDYVAQDQMVFLEDNGGQNSSTLTPGKANSFPTMPPPSGCSILTVNGQDYENGSAQFGASQYTVTGTVVLVDDGTAPITDACQAVQNNVSGKIALLDRGNCEFGFKALQAQNAGAIAVIVANNVPGAPPTMGAGAFGNQVTIPVISVSLADGNAIKTALNNGPVSATLDNQYTVQCTPWGITRVGGGLSGAGKRAWIIDSGIDLTHPDLNVNTSLSTFFAGSSPQDETGHGTHVAGTIAAKDNSFGVVGVAAGAEVVSVRVFGATGGSPFSVIIQGVDYVAANAAAGDVANMSLGGGAFAPIDDAVLAASAICKFVLAAGNDGHDANLNSPARVNGPNIYTVSAMDINDNWASFSNYGNPPVDYCEPGVGVVSCYLNGSYQMLNGTSMAAPHLSGLILLGNICSIDKVNGDPDADPDKIGIHDTGTSPDNDGDGFQACDECDDNDPSVYPGAPEICDGKDNDCDGIIDNGNVCCDGGTILYVKAGATGINSGTSWTDAYTDLQRALASTCPNVTQIWVAAGTYKPTPGLNFYAAFSMKNGVAIYGGFPGQPGQEGNFGVRNWTTNVTILSGDLKGDDGPNFSNWDDNSAVVVSNNGLDNTAVLDGVTIYGGGKGSLSGGMDNIESSPTISNVIFTGNWGTVGGAMRITNGNPIITNCKFDGNRGDHGGAMQILNGGATISGCHFTGNRTVYGGGIHFQSNSGSLGLSVSNSYFENNTAISSTGQQGSGGALIVNNFNSAVVGFTNCKFYNNKALGATGYGGHIILLGPLNLTNCSFAKGYANSQGGSIYLQNGSTINATNIISANNATAGGSPNFFVTAGATGTLTNCLLDDGCPAGLTCTSSLLNTDPAFNDVNSGNLTLNACSPAIDAGTSVGAPSLDIVGAARVDAIPGGGIVDIGAYEHQGLFGDVDADGDGYMVCEGDCNDGDPAINPGATEVCDGVDNNCDGVIDENNICCTGGIKVYVNAAATGLNNGTSWANAFTSLQTALGTSCVNEIWVAAGTYRPATNGDRTVSFVLKNGIAIYGGFPNTGNPGMADRNWLTNQTVLSGDLMQNDGQQPIATNAGTNTHTFDNSNTVVIGSGTDATAILDGFFITAGIADGYFTLPASSGGGGGMYLNGGTPTVNNCNFSGNWAYEGGGIYALNSAALNMTGCQINGNVAANSGGISIKPTSSFNLTDCSFTSNAATSGNGGGMENNSTAVSTLTNCDFTSNSASNVGGGLITRGTNLTMDGCTFTSNLAVNGAGMIISNSSPVISNCNFFSNVATNWGGGIINESGGNPTINNCLFQGNQALFGGGFFNNGASCQMTDCSFIANSINGAGGGAALCNYQSPQATVTNTVFRNNFVLQTNSAGAGVLNQFASPNLVNCTFSGNSADYGAVMISYEPSDNPTLTNCILFGNTTTNGESILNHNSSKSTLSYTLLQEAACPAGSTCGAGMVYGQNPLFVSPSDLHLTGCSPALDAGNDAANAKPVDLDGNPRKFDAIPGGSMIDMGAYEHQTLAFSGDILYVKANATGANDGSSWANAFTSLQSALNSSCTGFTQIWVAAGTYKPTTGTDRTISFVMKNGIAIYGGFVGNEAPGYDLNLRNLDLNTSYLSGDIGAAGNADNSYSVVTGSGTDNTAILDGFTIKDGNANAAAAPGNYNGATRNGGGFYNSGGSPTVRNCFFKANTAINFGGGMFNYSNTNTSPKIINCAFSGNTANGGGGICNRHVRNTSIPVITNCSFYGNTASLGGGIFVDSSKTQVINCIIWGNNSGLTIDPSDPVTITNSIIQGGCPQFATCTSVQDVNPLFVDAPVGNLHLQACSPAIDAGTATGAPATDYDGNLRPFAGGIDIGFDEYTGPPCCTFTLPADGMATVACPAQATQPTPPVVTSSCDENVVPTGPVITFDPNPLTCEGTKTYTWNYATTGTNLNWTFTYTIEREDFTMPANGSATVACPALAIQPIRPIVTDNCGSLITPTGPVITYSPDPLTCEGTKTYTWTYTDCEGNSHPWTFTYTIERNDFTVPANGSATVACPALATQPTPPTVVSDCGETITPTGPVIGATPVCEGTKTYTWTYTDCEGNTHDWTFTYTIERNDFTVPANGTATVACPALATQPTPPTVLSDCGETLTPTGPVVGATPVCEGTKTYTWTYTDCEGNTHDWTFTYTIERNDFTVPANGSATVACPTLATQPTPPTVLSDCGETLTPTGPAISATPVCEGTKTYTWTYTDCEGNTHDWTFTYTIERNDFTVPANGSTTVACPALATLPTPPVVQSDCGETITPTGPAISATPVCEGTKTYTWTYTDCEGNTHDWTFTYTIERNDFTVPANGSATVACVALATPPTPPTVLSDCGETLTPTGPVIINNPNPILCGGTRTYIYTYTDCEGNSHPWSFVYTINPVPFSVPANGAATVACVALATQPVPPVVSDACGNPTTPTGPVITDNPTPLLCGGTRTYTWTYTDCGGNMVPWSFVYTIAPVPFSVPANGAATVACPALATQPTPPVVNDACGNPTTPTGPVIVNNPNPIACEGTRTYTWTYVDCAGNMTPWSFVYTIERNDFTVPANGAATVNCPSAITLPTPPVVLSDCGETITPTGPVVSPTPACEGTKTYTWTYTDCEGNTHPWSFVYTIVRLDFTIGTPNGAATVNCPSAITQPTPPVVLSNCGETITPTGPVIVNNPNPLTCQGTRTYTWTYTDCAGHSNQWSFVYTVVRLNFTVPTNGAATVACPALATQPTPPVVLSNCGEILIPTGPVIVNNPNPLTCQGTRTYTWTYTDCAGHSNQWSFVYTVIRLNFSVPANGGSTVACPDQTDVQPTPPVVLSNCGEVLTPVLTNVTPKNGCEGNRNYTWTYTDCAGHSKTWTYIYTVEYEDFSVPASESYNVECPLSAQQPTPPTVYDNCGKLLNPTGPVITSTNNAGSCEGSRKYTWTYKDCEGNTHAWSVTYHFQYTADFFVYPDGVDYVGCLSHAQPPVPPTIYDNCGNVITITGPVVTEEISPGGCSGVRTFTYLYTDCGGHSHPWNFTYFANDNEPPVGNCPEGTVNSVNETNLSCIEQVPCPTDYDFTDKIHQLLAAGSFNDLCSGTNLVVSLDSWSALWECSDTDGDGVYTFGRTFYFSIADPCGNEYPGLCAVTYSGACQPITTFPQSTWGLEDETSNIDLGTIQHLLDAYGPLKVGGSARSLTLTDAQCVADLLPGQGGPDRLANCHQTNCIGCNPVGPGGMKNLLAANAIALQLSLRYSVEHNGANMAGMLAQSLGCIQLDPNIVSCTPTCKLRIFDQQGMQHFYPYTLGGLIDLVNFYLGGNVNLNIGQAGVYGTALNNALDAVSTNWGGQPSPTGCDPNPGATSNPVVDKALPKVNYNPAVDLKEGLGLELFPNPTSGKVTARLQGFGQAGAQLTVFDRLGRVVLQQKIGEGTEQLELDFSRKEFAAGEYFVRVVSSHGTLAKQLMIAK